MRNELSISVMFNLSGGFVQNTDQSSELIVEGTINIHNSFLVRTAIYILGRMNVFSEVLLQGEFSDMTQRYMGTLHLGILLFGITIAIPIR